MSGSTAHDFRRLTHARVKVAGSWRGLRRGQERHLTPRIASECENPQLVCATPDLTARVRGGVGVAAVRPRAIAR
jgi:hypothetical protein